MPQAINSRTFLPEFKRLLQEIAANLQGSVSRFPNDEDNWFGHVMTPDMELSIRLNSIDHKLEIKPVWPKWLDRDGARKTVVYRDISNQLTQEERNAVVTEIGCSVNKGAAKIAQDISRRLIANVKVAYDKAKECGKENERDWKAQNNLINELANYFGTTIRPIDPEKLYLDVAYLRVTSGNDSVHFEDFSCSVETAKKIVALLRAEKQAKTTEQEE